MIDLYAVGGIEMEALTIKINDITAKIDKLRLDKQEPPELSFSDAKKLFSDAKEVFTGDYDTERKRAILTALIKKIVLSGDQIIIHWRFE